MSENLSRADRNRRQINAYMYGVPALPASDGTGDVNPYEIPETTVPAHTFKPERSVPDSGVPWSFRKDPLNANLVSAAITPHPRRCEPRFEVGDRVAIVRSAGLAERDVAGTVSSIVYDRPSGVCRLLCIDTDNAETIRVAWESELEALPV